MQALDTFLFLHFPPMVPDLTVRSRISEELFLFAKLDSGPDRRTQRLAKPPPRPQPHLFEVAGHARWAKAGRRLPAHELQLKGRHIGMTAREATLLKASIRRFRNASMAVLRTCDEKGGGGVREKERGP